MVHSGQIGIYAKSVLHGYRFIESRVPHRRDRGGPPRLTNTDAASVRKFPRAYDQYAREVSKRACQLTGQNVISAEATEHVQFKYCVDPEWLESLIGLDLLKGVSSYGSLDDKDIRKYLDGKAQKNRKVFKIDHLDKLVEKELKFDMKGLKSRSRIETLFVYYRSLLRHHGLSWITDATK